LALDNKGRLAVPARHREVLAATANNQLTLTKHPDGCLMLFPRPAWDSFRDRLNALPMEAIGWKRVFLGNAQDVEIDSAGRVLVAPELRTWAGFDKNVMLSGLGNFFELWDAKRHAEHEAVVMSSGMPESLKAFSF
jgi:MraZ protein